MILHVFLSGCEAYYLQEDLWTIVDIYAVQCYIKYLGSEKTHVCVLSFKSFDIQTIKLVCWKF